MKKENLLDFSMFVLRIIIGAIFVMHGAQKLFGMFGGIGIEAVANMIKALGMPNPYVFAIIWSGIEFIGGIFLVLGILARWAAAAIALTVLIQLWGIDLAYGFFLQNGNVEYDLVVIASCIPIILLGGGSWSVWDV